MSYQERYIPKSKTELNNLVVITGVSGSGKDYLVEQAKNNNVLHDTIKIVPYGQEIFNRLQDVYPDKISSRDDLRKLRPDQWLFAVDQVADHILNNQPALVNAHVVIPNDYGVHLRPSVERKLKSQGYIFVWTDPEQVKEWREEDKSRKRDNETVDDIAFFQDLSMEVVEVIAKKIGSSFTTLWNRADNVIDNVTKIGEITKDLIK